jgi:predicted nucleotidyltransferase component of viral defense system
MLQTSTVETHTFSILKQLMQIKALENFCLVGGTCLSLRYGHRKSVDLDLFSPIDFDVDNIVAAINKSGLKFEINKLDTKVGAFGFIDDVKIDVVKNHHFDLIDNIEEIDCIRMYGDKDIIAMKIFAILQRAKKKDFWDIAELLNYYSINDFINFYKKKYPNNTMLISIPTALLYFDDAEESEDPISLQGQTWESVKQTISEHVNKFLA